MRSLHFCSIVVVVALASCAGLQAGVLYDASLNTLPTAQEWHYLDNPLVSPSAAQSASGGVLTMDSMTGGVPVGESAGFFSEIPQTAILVPPAYPKPKHSGIGVLDSSVGFAVRFTAQLVSESHVPADRAGFSIIVIDSTKKGVELGFWTDEIWAQADSPLFTHSPLPEQTTAFDPTLAMTQYELAFQAGGYTLSAGGNPLFGGPLKDYSAFAPPFGMPDVYEIPNFIFFGDDTGSAGAVVNITQIELVPEPATAAVLLVGFAAALARRKRPAA